MTPLYVFFSYYFQEHTKEGKQNGVFCHHNVKNNELFNKRAIVALNRSPELPVKQELFQIILQMLALKMIRVM